MRSLRLIATIPLLAGCAMSGPGRTGRFWELPCTNHPPVTLIDLDLRKGHPRLVFHAEPPGRTFDHVRKLWHHDPVFKSIFRRALTGKTAGRHPAELAACWIVSGEEPYAYAALDRLASEKIGNIGEQSAVWSYALAYDWLYGHPAMDSERRSLIERKLAGQLRAQLRKLDGHDMALWHGRNQAANNAMITALAIGDLTGNSNLLRRAAGHYADSLRALEYSEGWPEGASYWIYNRAEPYALAADCVITALGRDEFDGVNIRDAMRRIGFWQLYQYAPDGVFEPYGDSGGSITLGHAGWWTVATDHFARLSRDPGLMAGADYLRNRSPHPYGKWPLHWHMAVTYEPGIRPSDNYDPKKPEQWMRRNLPQSMLFGRDSVGVAFFRGDWGDPMETYASFKAGDLLAHHDHYDAGHFSIQKGGLLAPQTGLYSGYTGSHRIGYSIQTVSANSILVLAPGETSAYLEWNRKVKWKSLSGGQRVIRPTGFMCSNLDHYFNSRKHGPHLERADITAFESVPGNFDYVAANITAAYNSTQFAEPGRRAKVSLVTRQFLYLRDTDAFVVYDRVETTRRSYLPKFLLHHMSKPVSETESLLAGPSPENGILETCDAILATVHDRGRLLHYPLLPERARKLKIGGPDYCCYVEYDGTQTRDFNGMNIVNGDPAKKRTGAQLGLWRTEVEPAARSRSARFLNVLLAEAADNANPRPAVRLLESSSNVHAVRVGNTVPVFSRNAEPARAFTAEIETDCECMLMDAQSGGVYKVNGSALTATSEGILRIGPITPGRLTARLQH